MIKLKNILNELYALSGDAANSESILGYVRSRLPDEVMDKWMELSDTPKDWDARNEDNTLRITPKLKSELKKKAIWKSGDLLVYHVKSVKGSTHYYLLIDCNEPNLNTGVIGVIETWDSKSEVGDVYANTRFNLKGQEVHWSNLLDSKKGKGYGKMLYDAVLNYAGVLFSDHTLYDGSYNMWTHHLSKSTFFGAILSAPVWGHNILIPIDPSSTSKDELSKRVVNFVAINDRSLLSKTIRRFEYNTRGLDTLNEVGIISLALPFVARGMDADIMSDILYYKTKESYDSLKRLSFDDLCEEFESIQELVIFLKWVKTESPDVLNYVIKIPNETLTNSKRIKLLIVTLNDVTVLLKNKSEGISVQVMD